MIRQLSVLLVVTFVVACSTKSDSGGAVDNSCHALGGSNTMSSIANVVPITIGCGYNNEPCVSVKVCQHGTTNCQIINNILLDTGSYGLRIFACTHSLNLDPVVDGSNNQIAECVGYADGSADWGRVMKADVSLGTQTASNVPIQIVEAGYASGSTSCSGGENSPALTGFNGILGVGPWSNDCPTCTTNPNNGYFSCANGACTQVTATAAMQVTNPVTLMTDNNGVSLSLPSISASGATGVTGTMFLGIDTVSTGPGTNTFTGAGIYQASSSPRFRTYYPASNTSSYYSSFIDSGSNYMDFPEAFTICGSGLYCPTTTQNLTAKHQGYLGGTKSATINFSIVNADLALASNNNAYSNVGAPFASEFDWGLPFFYGRQVYVQFKGTSTTNMGSSLNGAWGW